MLRDARFLSRSQTANPMPRFSLRAATAAALVLCSSAPSAFAQCGSPQPPPFPVGATILASSVGIVANDGQDDRAAIQCAFNRFSSNNTLVFDVPNGVYELRGAMEPLGGAWTDLLTLNGKANIRITSVPGVRIELTGFDRAAQGRRFPNVLNVTNCSNFTLEGAGSSTPLVFTTRATLLPASEGLPLLQGKVQSVNVAQRTALVSVTDPELFLPPNCFPTIWAWVLPDGRPGFHAMYDGKVRAIAPPSGGPTPVQQVEFTFAGSALDFQNWQSGHDVVAVLNQSNTYALLAYDCSGTTTFRNLTAHHLPGKFLQTGRNDICNVENVDLLPEKAARLFSVGRDGINVEAKQSAIRDCTVAYCGDDAIVSNGSPWGRVAASAPTDPPLTFRVRSASTSSSYPPVVKVGSVVALIDGSSLSPASVQLAAITGVTWTSSVAPIEIRYAYAPASPALFAAALANPNTVVLDGAPSSAGAVIEDCSVKGVRGVGITTRGAFTRVSRCFVADALVCGIHSGGGLVDAYPWFGAGAPALGLTIENCVIDRCGGVAPYLAITGAIEIALAIGPDGLLPNCQYYIRPKYAPTPDVMQNVVLSRNVISRAPRAGLFAANVGGASGGLQVFGNTFIDCGSEVSQCLPETNSAITIENCGNGLVSANTFLQCANKFTPVNSSGVIFQ